MSNVVEQSGEVEVIEVGDVVATNSRQGGDVGGVVVGVFGDLVVFRTASGGFDAQDRDQLFVVARGTAQTGKSEVSPDTADTLTIRLLEADHEHDPESMDPDAMLFVNNDVLDRYRDLSILLFRMSEGFSVGKHFEEFQVRRIVSLGEEMRRRMSELLIDGVTRHAWAEAELAKHIAERAASPKA